jgi:hypothetical protein
MKKVLFAISLIAVFVAAELPSVAQVGGCQSAFFFGGSGATSFAFCVTPTGNIGFLTAAGQEFLFDNGLYEGYNVCDNDSGMHYWDFSDGGESGWGLATISQPNGPNSFPLKIRRKALDGSLTFDQSYSWDTTGRLVKIAMTLKNTGISSRNLTLWRYFNGNPAFNGSETDEYYSRGQDSVFAWLTGSRAMSLESRSLLFPRTTAVRSFSVGDASCTVYDSGLLPQSYLQNYEGLLAHTITLAAGASQVVTVVYHILS